MRRKSHGKILASLLLSVSMMSGLAACGNKPKSPDNEEVKGEITAADKEEGNKEGADSETSGQEGAEQESSAAYAPTEENDNPELTMNRQPESSYWFPAQLMEWKAEEDEDLIFNISTVPLAERVPMEELETVNETQNKDTKVMAVSIMNGSTSGNAPHGLNKMNANTFSYWQYVDTLVYWGGSSGEGLIVAPKAAFTADLTLAKPGDKITFTSLCSPNTEKVTWTLKGADMESAEGDTVTVSYAEEGVYPVALKADNSSGSADASVENYIVITNKAADGLQLLSQGAATEADTFVNENEAPEFAVDGDKTKKWCATGSAPHEITIDLGSVQAVSAVDVYHAQAGGESTDMNTKSYAIYTSEDGAAFEEVRSVTKNTAGETHDTFAPVNAQFVKLVVNKPTQGSDSAARIYEVEVYGLKNTID